MRSFISLLVGGLCASCTPVNGLRGNAAGTAPPEGRRVVLVHGFGQDGGAYSWMERQLTRRGFECLTPRLKPRDGRGGLEGLARRLKEDIDGRFGPDQRISVVGFSMGGIVSRYYLQELGGAERCDLLATISSPHHGTAAARWYPSRGAAEMRPGSDFLHRLAASEARLGNMPVVSYRTRFDLIILPPASSIWERAENIETPALLHPFMLNSPQVLNDLLQRLETAGRQAGRPNPGP